MPVTIWKRVHNSKSDSASIDTFLSWLENPLLRAVIRFAGHHDLKSGESYLEAALDDLTGEARHSSSLSSLIFSNIIKLAVVLGCKTFDVNWKNAVSALKVPYFKKGLVNVLNGIGKYGVTKPYRTPAPFLVVWNYTNACNLRCKHCYQRADKPTPDELTTEERLAIVDQLDENNVSALAFSGGEPLMRRDLFEVARYAHEKGLHVSVATNGTLLTRGVVENLKNSGVGYVEISLDGATRETHDSFRGVEGSFDMTLQGIKNAVKLGLYTGIATTAVKNNLYEIPEIIELAKKLGVKRVIVFNFIPTGRGEEILHLDLFQLREKSS